MVFDFLIVTISQTLQRPQSLFMNFINSMVLACFGIKFHQFGEPGYSNKSGIWKYVIL